MATDGEVTDLARKRPAGDSPVPIIKKTYYTTAEEIEEVEEGEEVVEEENNAVISSLTPSKNNYARQYIVRHCGLYAALNDRLIDIISRELDKIIAKNERHLKNKIQKHLLASENN